MKKILILMLILWQIGYGESLFESALTEDSYESSIFQDEESKSKKEYEFSGNLKLGVYNDNDIKDFREENVDGNLILDIKGFEKGKAYLKLNSFSKEDENDITLKEAYIDLYFDKFDFRIGKQIVVWGKADAVNPTNNINPRDMTLFTSNEDDIRMSKFILKSVYNFYPFNVEAFVIPGYRYAKTFLDMQEYAENNSISKAVKLNYEDEIFDGSISYYNGYAPTFGIDANMEKHPYKFQVIGCDLATTLGTYGLRTEFAYKLTDNYEDEIYTANPEMEWVLGLDREFFSKLNTIVQYRFKYVDNYNENWYKLPYKQNYILWGQTEEYQSSIIYRLSMDFLYETLELENLTNYNLNTKELFTRLKCTYKLEDNFDIIFGGDLYSGDDDTLFSMIEDLKSGLFFETKIYF